MVFPLWYMCTHCHLMGVCTEEARFPWPGAPEEST